MTKKKMGVLLAFVLLLLSASAAAVIFADSGDGKTDVCFCVTSDGSAVMTLKQTQGTCREFSLTHLFSGLSGKKKEWGKYHIDITAPDNTQTMIEWDQTFGGESMTVLLPAQGDYVIRVVPYRPHEMTDSWTLDQFVEWTEPPRWQIASMDRCRVSDIAGFKTLRIICCDEEGNTLETEYRAVYFSQYVSPPSVSGHSALSSAQYVRLNTMTGFCHPGTVRFLYAASETVSPASPIPFLPDASSALSLKDPGAETVKPQCGPGERYADYCGADGSSGEITDLRARFCTGGWVYAEFSCMDGVKRYGFFEKNLLTPAAGWDAVPEYTLHNERHGVMRDSTAPYNGPGYGYEAFPSLALEQWTEVYACMACGGWYLCRFISGSSGEVFLWVPGDLVIWF